MFQTRPSLVSTSPLSVLTPQGTDSSLTGVRPPLSGREPVGVLRPYFGLKTDV